MQNCLNMHIRDQMVIFILYNNLTWNYIKSNTYCHNMHKIFHNTEGTLIYVLLCTQHIHHISTRLNSFCLLHKDKPGLLKYLHVFNCATDPAYSDFCVALIWKFNIITSKIRSELRYMNKWKEGKCHYQKEQVEGEIMVNWRKNAMI